MKYWNEIKILTGECFDKNNQILGVVDEVWRP